MFSSGAGHSHIAPMLPLVAAARDEGHEIVFVTGPSAVRHAELPGVRTVAIGAETAGSFDRYLEKFPRETFDGLTQDEKFAHMMAHYMVGIGAAGRVGDLLDLVRDWRPDLVITNLAERAAMMAAVAAGVPYAMHAMGPPKSAALMADAWRVAGDIVRDFGVAELPPRDDVPYLDIWPDALYPGGVEWEYPARWPLRPEAAVPVAGEPHPALSGLPYERTVYVTSGTTHNTRPGVLEAMIGALREERVNVVATIGRDGDRERFGAQPAHVRIEHFVPQERLLPHVDAVVCHAGAGTVLGALAHGVPLVTTPLATDQFDAADQVGRAGAGVVAEASADAVRDAVGTVLADRSFREAAGAVAARIAAMPSPREVLDRLAR
ncbi:glycosyltransferase [Amycolatopsis minnesotensis]|uniref:Glycosyltransferase n=1 Tax=Amycolatopsis minnesotensis TaxID=337894 RepID=A0ABN2REM2_9PSEU